MPIWFKVAKYSEDIAKVFRLRHEVFVNQEHRFTCATNYVVDLYDTLNETINILAFDGEKAIGTIRVLLDNPVGLPSADYYDFSSYISKFSYSFSCFSWVCVLQEYKNYPSLLFGLFKMAVSELRKKGRRHIIVTLHPPLFSLLKRYFNAVRVGEDFVFKELNVIMTPAYIDTDAFPPRIRESFYIPPITPLRDSNVRRLYYEGESIINKGALGNEVFFIVRGSVRSLPEDEKGNSIIPGPDGLDPLGPKDLLFHQGEVFGELALLDEGERTSTIVPYSKEVDVVVWNKAEFLKQMVEGPETALNISRVLSKRIRKQISFPSALDPEMLSLIARILHDASGEGKSSIELVWLSRQCGVWPGLMASLMNLWQSSGLVSIIDERISILSPNKLREIYTKSY